LAGGGRYDNLIEILGGRSTPATGISLGIERIIEIMNQEKMFNLSKTNVKVYVANVNEKVKIDAVKITKKLRENNISCQTDLMNRSLKNQLEFADNMGIPFVLTVGEIELKSKKFKLKEMKTRKESELTLDEIIRKLQ
jgi:histidyl-tRNA synthetase